MLDVMVSGVANGKWISTNVIVKITAIGKIVMWVVVGLNFLDRILIRMVSFISVFFIFFLG